MIQAIKTLNLKKVTRFLVSFYVIGIIGMALPWTSAVFRFLTPFSLLMCFGLLAFFHEGKPTTRSWLLYLVVMVVGYAAEVIGVATGVVFGLYEYGRGLGIKALDVPLMLGPNWLFMVYTSSMIADKVLEKGGGIPIKLKKDAITVTLSSTTQCVLKISLGSLVMVAYDLIAEQVAPKLDLWVFEAERVPLQNYLSWFVLAVLFHTLFRIFKVSTRNPLSARLLLMQALFFAVLAIVL